jgi:type II secretory pathway component PulM
MKEWWVNLALREKQIIALGTVLVLIFIVYEFVFAALSDANQNLRAGIQKNQSMLAWMNATDKRIQAAANNHQAHVAVTSASLLSALQDDLNQNPISKNVTELQQADNDSVEVHFKQVGFDNMMRWLLEAGQKLQLTVTSLSITPTDSIGQVDAVLKLAAK